MSERAQRTWWRKPFYEILAGLNAVFALAYFVADNIQKATFVAVIAVLMIGLRILEVVEGDA